MKKYIIISLLMAICFGAAAQEKIYSVKSGIITMEMDMMGQAVVQEIYFDDYGAKKATVMNMRGQKTRNIVVDGKTVMVNDEEKTAMTMPSMGPGGPGGGPGFGPGAGMGSDINFLNLDEKTIKKNKIKELGEEEIIGLPCKKYSYRVMMMGGAMTTYVWVYKGITLKTSMKTDFGEMGMAATKLQEDVEIDPAMFVVPEGVTIQEMRRPAGPPQGFDF